MLDIQEIVSHVSHELTFNFILSQMFFFLICKNQISNS